MLAFVMASSAFAEDVGKEENGKREKGFYIMPAYSFGRTAFAPVGKTSERGNNPVIDGVRLSGGARSERFESNLNGYSFRLGYGMKDRDSGAGGAWELGFSYYPGVTKHNYNISSVKEVPNGIGGTGNIVGPKYNFDTDSDFMGIDLAYRVIYPKILNWVFYYTMGPAGLVLGFLNPSFYLDIGGAYNMARLEYSGDINTKEFYSGVGFLLGLGLEFRVSDNFGVDFGWRSTFSISDSFPSIGGYRAGVRYYF